MTDTSLRSINFDDPIAAFLARPDDAVIALIADIEGPSYRPLGASMTVLGKKEWVGTLSSGCIESDISLHAMEAKKTGTPRLVKYGRGSPYFDIKLPCGGGLEILLLPNPDIAVLEELQKNRLARKPLTLRIDLKTAHISLHANGGTTRNGNVLSIRFEPEPHFVIFGKGPEAGTFAALVEAAGYSNMLVSPDEETLHRGSAAGCATRRLNSPSFPSDLHVDHRSAIVLFFHDHEWEPTILLGALGTKAFYIGAQGSRAVQAARRAKMMALGANGADLDRLSGPIGLIPSARDARTLAVSVLSEILAKLKDADT